MRRLVSAILIALAPLTMFAQSVTDRSGVSNILGAGARALGMAGAFTAIADDATAATWNPAGLQILSKPEASLVYQYYDSSLTSEFDFVSRNDDGSLERLTSFNDVASTSDAGILFASATLPFEWKGRRIVGQASYRRLVAFPETDNPFAFRDAMVDASGRVTSSEERSFLFHSDDAGGIDDYSLSAATRVFRTLDAGLSLNYMRGNGEFSDLTQAIDPLPSFQERMTTDISFSGLRFDLGLLYRLGDRVSFGAVYHSGLKTDLDYRTDVRDFTPELGDSGSFVTSDTTEVRWPDGYAFGVAVRPIGPFTLAVDYQKTNWSKAKIDSLKVTSIRIDPDEYVALPFEFQDAGFPTLGPQFDTGSIRAGAEYIFVNRYNVDIPVRVGYFTEDQLNAAAGLEKPRYRGLTFGTGFGYKNLQIDIAYIRTLGEERSPSDFEFGLISNTAEFVGERFLASLIYRFQ